MTKILCAAMLVLTAAMLFTPSICAAQSNNQSIYSDQLDNGWQDWSWTTHSLTNTSPVYAGADSISATLGGWGGVFLHNGNQSTSPYGSLQFYVNGGATGGQNFAVAALADANTELGQVMVSSYVPGGVIPANTWVLVSIPLTALGAAEVTNFSGIWLQDVTGNGQSTFYVDNISLVGNPVPSTVTATVNTKAILQTVDQHVYGVNTAIWDSDIASPTVINLLKKTPVCTLRWPGGSASDGYDWTKSTNGGQMTDAMQTLAAGIGAGAYITLNYGSGTPQMAEAWAAYCDSSTASTTAIGVDSTGRNWYTSGYWAPLRAASPLATDDGLNVLRANHPAGYGFTRFEIGNECYGSWEYDTHVKAQDPVIYAQFFQTTTALIKKIIPTALVGAVIEGDEDSGGNQTEAVTNPVTNVQHSGWTSVLFSTLNGLKCVPDFVIYHSYPEAPGSESDYNLLHNSNNWTGVATEIRTMLTDYFGSTAVNTKLACTENNSVYGNPGKQSTSLVNGLFYADSLGTLLQTEFHTLLWWDLHNGGDTSQNNSSGLYGWREYGDYGMLSAGGSLPGEALDTTYPSYMALALFEHFGGNGDSVLPTTTSYSDLALYATKKANGVVDLLVINKNPTASFGTTIALSGYTPAKTATEWSYGIPQDNAQEAGSTAALSQSTVAISGATFTQSFAPYSMTVIQLNSGG